jgi:hypothetical protein
LKRSAKIAVVVGLAGLLAALTFTFGTSPSTAAEPPGPAELRAQESVLRLTELPTGYVLGGGPACDTLRPSEEAGAIIAEGGEPEPPTPYEVFLTHHATSSCLYTYERLYRPAGASAEPAAIFSFVVRTPSVGAATEALSNGQLAEEMSAAKIAGEVREEGFRAAGSQPALGESSLRFRTNQFYWDSLPADNPPDRAGTMVIWHQGNLVAGILAGGAKPAVNDAAAARYGALQQKLLEAPRPYVEAESEDIPTFLGNPNLGVPVYWLGKEFDPANGGEGVPFVRADGRERLTHRGRPADGDGIRQRALPRQLDPGWLAQVLPHQGGPPEEPALRERAKGEAARGPRDHLHRLREGPGDLPALRAQPTLRRRLPARRGGRDRRVALHRERLRKQSGP